MTGGYRLCVFDLDGTLLDTLSDLHISANFALREFSLKERSRDEIRRFVGNGIRMLIKRAADPVTDEKTLEGIYNCFINHYSSHLNDNTAPYPGVADALARLHSKGIATAVFTNKNQAAAEMLISCHFGENIDFTLGHRADLPTKPDPQGLKIIMSESKAENKSTLFFGDSDVDIFTAKNAGVKSAGVTWGFRERHTLENAGADYIIDTADEIIGLALGCGRED